MVVAVLFGIAASSALVIGAAVGARWSSPTRLTGVLLAFGSGAFVDVETGQIAHDVDGHRSG